MESGSDEEIQNGSTEIIDDYLILQKDYETRKKQNISKPVLTKYERTSIISERVQQLSNGSVSFIKNPESHSSIFNIAVEELRQGKLPFIIKRPVANSFEYWKLSDLSIL